MKYVHRLTVQRRLPSNFHERGLLLAAAAAQRFEACKLQEVGKERLLKL